MLLSDVWIINWRDENTNRIQFSSGDKTTWNELWLQSSVREGKIWFFYFRNEWSQALNVPFEFRSWNLLYDFSFSSYTTLNEKVSQKLWFNVTDFERWMLIIIFSQLFSKVAIEYIMIFLANWCRASVIMLNYLPKKRSMVSFFMQRLSLLHFFFYLIPKQRAPPFLCILFWIYSTRDYIPCVK